MWALHPETHWGLTWYLVRQIFFRPQPELQVVQMKTSSWGDCHGGMLVKQEKLKENAKLYNFQEKLEKIKHTSAWDGGFACWM